MKEQELKEKKANSKYCNRVNKLFSLGYIDLPLSNTLVFKYMKATEEKQSLLDNDSELALLSYTNGISLLNKINKSNERINKNVQFFFWVTIIGWICGIIISIQLKTR